MSNENNNLAQRIENLDGKQAFLAYTNATDHAAGSSFYACFDFARSDLRHILELAHACQQVNAEEITTHFIAKWSDSNLRTDLDRLEVTPTSRSEDPVQVSLQLRSCVRDSDQMVTSDVWRLGEMMTAIEMALARGDNEIWVGNDSALQSDQEQLDLISDAKDGFTQPAVIESPHW